uniref:Uncharacterized protein n=1 Tax=Anguilla anguilla TaxID=7936 RepID=A0A0E9XUM6_ANGAN
MRFSKVWKIMRLQAASSNLIIGCQKPRPFPYSYTSAGSIHTGFLLMKDLQVC